MPLQDESVVGRVAVARLAPEKNSAHTSAHARESVQLTTLLLHTLLAQALLTKATRTNT